MKITIVGLPIGNIEDISFRTLNIIQNAKYLICEDTRNFNNLWTKLVQLGKVEKFSGTVRFINDYNEPVVLPRILAEICSLEEIVLISDAGMPLISDPGYKLINRAIDLGWEIDVVPGPTAESAALAVSGLPTDKFLFVGFLPKKPGKRSSLLKNIKEISKVVGMTVIIYESSLRLLKTLAEAIDIYGDDIHACLAVDLTKISQKIFRGSLGDLLRNAKDKRIKGEVVILVSLPS